MRLKLFVLTFSIFAPSLLTAQTNAATNASATAAPSIATNLILTVVGVIIVLAIGFGIWNYTRSHPEQVTGALNKIGAEVPEPLDPDDAHVPEPTSPTAEPEPGPIILQPAGPDLEPIQVAAAADPIRTSPCLVDSAGEIWEIPQGSTEIGREAAEGLWLETETVSRRHAVIEREANQVTVRDIGSTNGTWVNGRRLDAPATLAPGDTISFGTAEFTYRG